MLKFLPLTRSFLLVRQYWRQGNQLAGNSRSNMWNEEDLGQSSNSHGYFQRKSEQGVLTDLDGRNEERVKGKCWMLSWVTRIMAVPLWELLWQDWESGLKEDNPKDHVCFIFQSKHFCI